MHHFNWACPVSPMCLNSWFLLWNFLWHMVHDSTAGAAAVLAFCFSRLAASLRCLFDSAGWLCSSSLSGPAEAVLAPAASGLCVALVPFWSAAGPGPGSGWAVPACAGSSAAQTGSGTGCQATRMSWTIAEGMALHLWQVRWPCHLPGAAHPRARYQRSLPPMPRPHWNWPAASTSCCHALHASRPSKGNIHTAQCL